MPFSPIGLAPEAYVATPDNAPAFWQLGNLWRIMATWNSTNNYFCLLDQLVTPDGGGPCTHMHPSDEGLYVVSGHCTFHAGGQTISAGSGFVRLGPAFHGALLCRRCAGYTTAQLLSPGRL